MSTAEYPLPAQQNKGAARKAEGFATPKEDKKPQCARMLPKRVLPIIFLPGIMGSNLRMSDERQKELYQKDNIAWRPDSLGATNISKTANSQARDRQLRLDPLQTTVDIYDPSRDANISGDKRHSNVKIDSKLSSPLLKDDPTTIANRRTAIQKARERGWGEVFFGSYGELLQHLESRLNNTFYENKLREDWHDVIGVDPHIWGAHPSLPQSPLTEDELKAVATACWFAVYAFGYNWLQCNGISAHILAARIDKVLSDLKNLGYECNQAIIVTHSMGGLVGRALIHPDYGNLKDKILGIVHGVMPSIGAPAAYKRIRAGFEDLGIVHGPTESISAKVAGNYGDEVTAVLANAPGGLELLPSQTYGDSWLRVVQNGKELETWPKHGNPYDEIYKVKGKWYSLFRTDWINPSKYDPSHGGGSFDRTCDYLDQAKHFHEKISDTFHPNSYAHYGGDPERLSYGEVIWQISKNCADTSGWKEWQILSDTKQGNLELVRWNRDHPDKAFPPPVGAAVPNSIYATILPPTAPGDQTVPLKSADHQLKSGKFAGIFRQRFYEHQSSFKDPAAVASTLYSIVRIAQMAKWNC